MEDAATPRRGRARWQVAGRVQGVGFRWFVIQAARRHGVQGDVRNLPDGGVEVRAEGSREALEALLDEIRRGPAGARVEEVHRLQADANLAFDRFDIRR